MSSVVISGDTSGAITLSAPAVAGTNTITLPAQTGTVTVGGPAFSAYQGTSQTGIANTTNTKIVYDTEEFDTGGCFNNTGSTVTLNGISTPSYSFAPNVAGYYMVTVATAIPLTTNNYGLFTALYKNGSVIKFGTTGMSNGAMYMQSANTFLVYLNGTSDYVAGYVYGSTGGSFSLVTGAYTFMSAAMVRSA